MFEIPKSSPSAGQKHHSASVSTALWSLRDAAVVWGMEKHAGLLARFKEWCKYTGSLWIVESLESYARGAKYTARDLSSFFKDPSSQPFVGEEGFLLPDGRFITDRSEALRELLEITPSVSFDTLGRLALKEEAAGKIRVFAMVDAFTQWALKPLHTAVMSTIST